MPRREKPIDPEVLMSDPVLSPATQLLLDSDPEYLNSPSRFPSIRSKSLGASAASTGGLGAAQDKAVSLPRIRRDVESARTDASKQSVAKSHKSALTMCSSAVDASVDGALSTAPTTITVGEWRTDEHLNTWYKEVQRREMEKKMAKVKQANKDAQWILTRRQAQMKVIEKRQKLEKLEAEQKMRGPALGRGALAQQKFKRATTLISGMRDAHSRAQDRIENPDDPDRPEYTEVLPVNINRGALQWQPIQKTKAVHKEPKDVAVWVKPGVFVTKQLQ